MRVKAADWIFIRLCGKLFFDYTFVLKMSKSKGNRFYFLLTGITAALLSAVYFLLYISLPMVDNPSSTYGFIYPVAVISSLIAGGVGLLIGLLIFKTVDLIANKSSFIKNTGVVKKVVAFFIIAGYITLTLLLYLKTRQENSEYNAKNTIEVKFDSGFIEKQSLSAVGFSHYNPDLNREHAIGRIGGVNYEIQKEFIWNGKKYFITYDRDTNHILVMNEDHSVFIDHSLEGYNYITGVTYVIMENEKESFLWVLTRLRATSSMSVLNVFSTEGKMVYEELMGRNNILETGEVNGQKVMVIGNKDIRGRNDTITSVSNFVFIIKTE